MEIKRGPIPETYYQFAQRIQVKYVNTLAQTHGALGEDVKNTNDVLLQPNVDGYPLPVEIVEQAFFHEYAHKMFDFAGRSDLSDDEKLVDICGHLIHELLSTAEYGKGRK